MLLRNGVPAAPFTVTLPVVALIATALAGPLTVIECVTLMAGLVGGFSAWLKLMNDVFPVGPAFMLKLGFGEKLFPLKLLLTEQVLPPPPPPPPPPGHVAFVFTNLVTFAPIGVFFTLIGSPEAAFGLKSKAPPASRIGSTS